MPGVFLNHLLHCKAKNAAGAVSDKNPGSRSRRRCRLGGEARNDLGGGRLPLWMTRGKWHLLPIYWDLFQWRGVEDFVVFYLSGYNVLENIRFQQTN